LDPGTPRKLATAISENYFRPELNTLLNVVAQIEETATQLMEKLRKLNFLATKQAGLVKLRCRMVS
jgi:hypothetical protein